MSRKNEFPFFFAFEGIDGAGKSSLIAKVKEKLLEVLTLAGDPVMVVETHRLPMTDVPLGADLRQAVKDQLLTVEEEILGLTMNRSQAVGFLRKTILEERRERSTIILMDRWFGTCVAYQGTDAPHLSLEISALHKRFVQAHPRITFLLDIDPQVALSRMLADRPLLDPNEQDIMRQASIRRQYQHLAKVRSDWVQLNGEYPQERLAMMVVEAIFECMKKDQENA